MGDSQVYPSEPPADLLTTAREWIWRHSSQPNGDPWDSDPDHLDLAARNLLKDLSQWLIDTEWLIDTDTKPRISRTSAEPGRPAPISAPSR